MHPKPQTPGENLRYEPAGQFSTRQICNDRIDETIQKNTLCCNLQSASVSGTSH